MIAAALRRCSRCGQDKPAEEFYPSRPWACKSCELEKKRASGHWRPAKHSGALEWRECECEACGKHFAYRSRHVRKYCSAECGSQRPGKRRIVLAVCDGCGKSFETTHSRLHHLKRGKQIERHFCSPECHAAHRYIVRYAANIGRYTAIEYVTCACGRLVVTRKGSQGHCACGQCRQPDWRREYSSLASTYGIVWVNAIRRISDVHKKRMKHMLTSGWQRKFEGIIRGWNIRSRHGQGGSRHQKRIASTWSEALGVAMDRARASWKRQVKHHRDPWRVKFETMARNWRRKARHGCKGHGGQLVNAIGAAEVQMRFDWAATDA